MNCRSRPRKPPNPVSVVAGRESSSAVADSRLDRALGLHRAIDPLTRRQQARKAKEKEACGAGEVSSKEA